MNETKLLELSRIEEQIEIRRLRARVEELQCERDDLKNQILDLGVKARRFTPNDQLRARVAELSEPQVGIVQCPNCDEEHTVSLSRGRTNDPNRPDKSREGKAPGDDV